MCNRRPEAQRALTELVTELRAHDGALAAAAPDTLVRIGTLTRIEALRAMFVLYGALGLAVFLLYRRLPAAGADAAAVPTAPLGPSRGVAAKAFEGLTIHPVERIEEAIDLVRTL